MVVTRWLSSVLFGGGQPRELSASNPQEEAKGSATSSRKWNSNDFPPLPTARSACAAAFLPHEGVLMVLGGVGTDGHDLATVDCLFLSKQSWMTGAMNGDSGDNHFLLSPPCLRRARHGCAAVVVRHVPTAPSGDDQQPKEKCIVVVTGGTSTPEEKTGEGEKVESHTDDGAATGTNEFTPTENGDGKDQSVPSRNVEIWDLSGEKFVELPATLQNPYRDGCALVVSPSKSSIVHVVGGHDGRGTYHKSVESYDLALELQPAQRIAPASLALRKWFSLPDMPLGRAYCAAVCLFHEDSTLTPSVASATAAGTRSSGVDAGAETPPLLVVLGGSLEGGVITNSVECFDFESQRWFSSLLPPMQHARAAFAAVVADHVIYVIGGVGTNGEILDSCEVLHLGDSEWKMLPERLSRERAGCAASVVECDDEGKKRTMIMVVGGHDGEELLTSVECLELGVEGGQGEDAGNGEGLDSSWNKEFVLPEISPPSEEERRDLSAGQGWFDATAQSISHVKDKTAEARAVWQEQRTQVMATQGRLKLIQQQLVRKQHQLQLQRLDLDFQRRWELQVQGRVDAWMTQTQGLLKQARDDQENLLRAKAETHPAPWTGTGIPSQLLCPLSKQLMVEPVIAADGYAYERQFIEEYMHQFSEDATVISPTSNMVLSSRTLIPAVAIQSMCDEYRRFETQLVVSALGDFC